MNSEIFNFGIFFIFQRCTDRNYTLKLISNDEKDAIKRVSKEELKTLFRGYRLQFTQNRTCGSLRYSSNSNPNSCFYLLFLLLFISWELPSVILFVCLFGFLMYLSKPRLYRRRAPRQSGQFYVLPSTRQSWKTKTSVSAGQDILTLTQPVGSGRPQRESNPGPPHQESCALPTELPRSPPPPPPLGFQSKKGKHHFI